MIHLQSPLDPFHVLHSCLCKLDIPEVEAVIRLIAPQLEGHLAAVADEAVERAEQSLRVRSQVEGSQGLDRFLEDLVITLLSLYAIRTSTDLPAASVRGIERGTGILLAQGARSEGLTLDLNSAAEIRLAAREDLITLLRGHLELRRSELKDVLREFTSHPSLRELGGPVPTGAESVLPEALTSWRERLRGVLGGKDRRWIGAVTDLWAYRWWNLGIYYAGKQVGVLAWEAVAVLDRRTTAFCRWVDGRVVEAAKIERQAALLQRAARERSPEQSVRAWPLLDDPKNGTEKVWETWFSRSEVGLPPYHWRCRTTVRPLRLNR